MTLKEARRRAGLTQEKLAQKSGLVLRTIAYIESGKSTPRFDTQRRLLSALGISWENRHSVFPEK